MEKTRVLILGGGLAGLAAGWTLRTQSRGEIEVEILERGDIFGGKASSVEHARDGRTQAVDHGLHVFFAYPNFRRLLAEAAPGALNRLKRGAGGSSLVIPPSGLAPLSSAPLPSPFHLLGALPVLLRPGLSWGVPADALALARIFLAAILLRPEQLSPRERRRLDDMTFLEFAASLGASTTLLGSDLLNQAAHANFSFVFSPSALSLLRSFRLTQQNRAAQEVLYLDGPCGSVLVDPLREAFLRAGGQATPHRPVREIVRSGERVSAIEVEDVSPRAQVPAAAMTAGDTSFYGMPLPPDSGARQSLHADYYVSALPPRALEEALDPGLREHPYFAPFRRFSVAQTMSYQVYYDRLVTPASLRHLVISLPGPFSALIDRARIWTHPDGAGSVLELVGEAGMLDPAQTDEDVIRDADEMLARLFPDVRAATVLGRWFHRNVREDYFVLARGTESDRPSIASPLANLFLAGDYTAHSFGAVGMEGAVVSGIEAANGILRAAGHPARDVLPMAEPGGLVPLVRAALKATGLFGVFLGYQEHV